MEGSVAWVSLSLSLSLSLLRVCVRIFARSLISCVREFRIGGGHFAYLKP